MRSRRILRAAIVIGGFGLVGVVEAIHGITIYTASFWIVEVSLMLIAVAS